MKLTTHQKRILAAMNELNIAHNLRWWDRESIGRVVGAGGFHNVIQIKSMTALKSLGLVMTERESWSEEVRQTVQCGCAQYEWGLTEQGESIAKELSVRWSDEAKASIIWCGIEKKIREHVQDGPPYERRWWQDRDEDDDDGDVLV